MISYIEVLVEAMICLFVVERFAPCKDKVKKLLWDMFSTKCSGSKVFDLIKFVFKDRSSKFIDDLTYVIKKEDNYLSKKQS